MHPLKDHGQVLDFEDYVRTRHATLLRCAQRLVADPLDAQDLLQTALLRTYHRWEHIADKRLADAYLRRVMINTRTEWWRARKLQELPTDHLPDASVEDQAEQHADRALLMDIIKTLPPQQLSVLVLRYWEQMSTDETATTLGMAPGTVKSTLHRALARLRQELQRRDPDSASASAPVPAGHIAGTRVVQRPPAAPELLEFGLQGDSGVDLVLRPAGEGRPAGRRPVRRSAAPAAGRGDRGRCRRTGAGTALPYLRTHEAETASPLMR